MLKHKSKAIGTYNPEVKLASVKQDFASSFISSIENLADKSEEVAFIKELLFKKQFAIQEIQIYLVAKREILKLIYGSQFYENSIDSIQLSSSLWGTLFLKIYNTDENLNSFISDISNKVISYLSSQKISIKKAFSISGLTFVKFCISELESSSSNLHIYFPNASHNPDSKQNDNNFMLGTSKLRLLKQSDVNNNNSQKKQQQQQQQQQSYTTRTIGSDHKMEQQYSQRSDGDKNIALKYIMGTAKESSNNGSPSLLKIKQDQQEINRNQFDVGFQINKFQEQISQMNSQKVMDKAMESPKRDSFDKLETATYDKAIFTMNVNALIQNYSYLNENYSSLLCFIESLLAPLANIKISPTADVNFQEVKQKFQLFKSIQAQMQQSTVDLEFMKRFINKNFHSNIGSPFTPNIVSSLIKETQAQQEVKETPIIQQPIPEPFFETKKNEPVSQVLILPKEESKQETKKSFDQIKSQQDQIIIDKNENETSNASSFQNTLFSLSEALQQNMHQNQKNSSNVVIDETQSNSDSNQDPQKEDQVDSNAIERQTYNQQAKSKEHADKKTNKKGSKFFSFSQKSKIPKKKSKPPCSKKIYDKHPVASPFKK